MMLNDLTLVVSHIAAGVLAVAGVSKLRTPRTWVTALHQLAPKRYSARIGASTGRVFGLIELALAVAVMVVGVPVAFAAVSAVYAVFVVVSAVAWRKDLSCGCFGARSANVGLSHLLLNLCATAAAAHVAIVGTAHPWLVGSSAADSEGVVVVVTYVAVIGLGVASIAAIMTMGADLAQITRKAAERTAPAATGHTHPKLEVSHR